MKRILLAAAVAASTALCSFGAWAQTDDRPSLVIAMAAMQRSHPAIAESNFDSRVIKSVMDGLLNRDWLNGPNGNDGTEIVPGIFTEWTQVDDLTWDFKVRQGVKFHNGRDMTIDDVLFTLSAERLWGPTPIEPHSLASSFAKVEAVDPETVRITTKYPDPVLLQRLAHVIGHVVPKKEYLELGKEAYSAAPIGTGPYKWDHMIADEEIVLTAFDDYWGEKPPLKQITFKAVPETSARIAGLITGQYDIITSIPPDQAELVDQEPDYETRTIEVENMHHLTFMTGCGEENQACERKSPVHDPLVRKAMILSLDREKIADRLWNGMAKVPAGPNWEMYGKMFDADRKAQAFDPEQAKQLLAEAGYDGQEIVVAVTTGYYVNGDRAVQVMMQMWEAVGLNVRLQFVENWAQMRPYGWQDLWINSSNIRIPDPLSPFWWRFGEPSASYVTTNLVAVSDDYRRVGNTLERTLDEDTRIAAFKEGLDLWQEENPAIILYRPLEIYGVRKDIKWTPYSFFWMDFRANNFSLSNEG